MLGRFPGALERCFTVDCFDTGEYMRFRRGELFCSHWVLWIGVFLLSTLLQLLGWVERLRFDRSLLDDGHVLLLFSSQLVHLNWSHWALNMAGMLMIALLFGRYGSVFYWLWVLGFSALVVGAGLWWLNPGIRWYAGLSGVLHGLMLAGILQEMRISRITGGFLLLLITVKLAWEQLVGAMAGSESLIGGRVVVDSHLYGAMGGAVAAVLWCMIAGKGEDQDCRLKKTGDK